jgi:glycosyltransferase involved in cell wall biosynthesis
MENKIKLLVLLHDLIPLQNHNLVQIDSSGVYLRFAQLITRADKVVCISQDVEEKYKGWRKVIPEAYEAQQIYCRPFPLECNWLTEDDNVDITADIDFLMIGSPTRRKNARVAAAALLEIVKHHPSANLHIYGSGAYKPDLEFVRLNSLREIASNIHIHLDRPDSELVTALKSCKALLFPSLQEGFGLPLLEAAFFNKVVIASDVEPIATIGKQLGCHLAEPENISSWSNLMLECLNFTSLTSSKLPGQAESWSEWQRELLNLCAE